MEARSAARWQGLNQAGLRCSHAIAAGVPDEAPQLRTTLTAMAWSAAHGFAALEASGRLKAQLPGASEAGIGEAMIDRLAEFMLPED